MKMRLLLLTALLLAGCGRGCGRPAPTLSVAATTTASLVMLHPRTNAPPWRLTVVAHVASAVAPTFTPDPALPERSHVRWSSPDGTHELRLLASEDSLHFDAPHGGGSVLFDELHAGPELALLAHGVVLETPRGAQVRETAWVGALGDGRLEVIDYTAGDDGVTVVLRDGIPLDFAALGGSLRRSLSRGDAGRLTRLEVVAPLLSFTLEWPDPTADEVRTTATLDGRATPLVLHREVR
jgi:hypothetical protein